MMGFKEEYMKTTDTVKLLEMLKLATKNGNVDKEMIHHFNEMIKKQALELYGERDPDIIYENTEFLRKSLREKH